MLLDVLFFALVSLVCYAPCKGQKSENVLVNTPGGGDLDFDGIGLTSSESSYSESSHSADSNGTCGDTIGYDLCPNSPIPECCDMDLRECEEGCSIDVVCKTGYVCIAPEEPFPGKCMDKGDGLMWYAAFECLDVGVDTSGYMGAEQVGIEGQEIGTQDIAENGTQDSAENGTQDIAENGTQDIAENEDNPLVVNEGTNAEGREIVEDEDNGTQDIQEITLLQRGESPRRPPPGVPAQQKLELESGNHYDGSSGKSGNSASADTRNVKDRYTSESKRPPPGQPALEDSESTGYGARDVLAPAVDKYGRSLKRGDIELLGYCYIPGIPSQPCPSSLDCCPLCCPSTQPNCCNSATGKCCNYKCNSNDVCCGSWGKRCCSSGYECDPDVSGLGCYTPPSPDKCYTPGSCFSSKSEVTQLTSHGPTTTVLEDIRAGDQILAFDENGEAFFDEVYWIHYIHLKDNASPMLNLHHEFGTLRLTADHLVYIAEKRETFSDTCIDLDNQKICVYEARHANVGDSIWVVNPETMQFEMRQITDVTFTREKFLNPVTFSGNLVVDGVAVSAFSKRHDFGKESAFPIRTLYYLCGNCTNHIYADYVWESLGNIRRGLRDAAMHLPPGWGKLTMLLFYFVVLFPVLCPIVFLVNKLR